MSEPIDDPEWWRGRYPGCQPLGYELRSAFPARWFRIHSLPEGQRYPADEADWTILLRRHRAVSDAVLHTGSPCYLITPWSCAGDDCFSGFTLREMGALPEYRPDPEEPPGGGFFGTRFAWDFDRFEAVLRAVAEWQVLACVVAEERLCAYAPYDGGADLFLPDAAGKDGMRDRFRHYLSRRKDGL